MVDYGNHKRFSLKYLSAGITPVSIRLKNTVRTPRSYEIMKRAEKWLQNERIRAINNTITISSWERDTCINQLASILDEGTFKEWHAFIYRATEARHKHVRGRQVSKFNRLWLKTSCGNLKDHSGSSGGKVYGFMYNSYSGHSNPSPSNSSTHSATTTTTTTTPSQDTRTNGSETCQVSLSWRHKFHYCPGVQIKP